MLAILEVDKCGGELNIFKIYNTVYDRFSIIIHYKTIYPSQLRNLFQKLI